MTVPVSGSGSAAAAAAAEAARRAAAEAARKAAEEAARRAAEAARQAAEAARKAAEAAQRAAAEAAQKAAEQAKVAEQAKATAKQSVEQAKAIDPQVDPAGAKKAIGESQKATKEAAAQRTAAEQAQKAAEQARQTAQAATKEAFKKTNEANAAAKAEGKPEPFPRNEAQQRTAFDPLRADDTKLGNSQAAPSKEMQAKLDADRDYARLTQRPETRQALDTLGVKDGSGLKMLGEQVSRSAEGKGVDATTDKRLAEAQKTVKPEALSEILQSAGKAAGEGGKALAEPELANAIARGKTPRDANLTLKAGELPPETKANLERVGVSPKDYAAAKPEAQRALDAAGQAAGDNKPAEALDKLREASTHGARTLAETGVETLARNQPPGLGRDLLSDPAVAKKALDDAGTRDALGQVLGGEPQARLEGLEKLTRDDGLRDTALDAASKDPSLQQTLREVGLKGADLKTLGEGAADVLDAVRELQPGGDTQKALESLSHALEAAPDLAQGDVAKKLLDSAAKTLPDMAKELLSNPQVREQVLAGGAAALDAVGKLGGGQALEGLASLAQNEKLRGAVAGVVGKSQELKAALDKVGLEPKDLLSLKDALPSVLDAAQKVGQKDFAGALDSMREALQQGGPLSEKMLGKLADQLPDSMGVGKRLLQDPAVINELIHNDEAFASAKDLFTEGKTLEGVSGLLANDSLRGAVLDVVGKEPAVQEKLASVGLSVDDLKQAGDAAPHLFEAGRALLEGGPDIETALSELGQAADAAPELLAKLGGKIAEKMPEPMKEKLSQLGITPEHLKEAGAALPHLVNAAQSFANGDLQAALASIGQALKGSPEIVSTMISTVGEKLPDGLLKDVLTDKALVKELVTNEDLHTSIGQLLSGTPEGLQEGLRGISANEPAMTAVADSLWKNEGLRTQLERVGFTSAQDLADAGGALDDVMTLKDALTGDPVDVKGAIDAGLNILNALPEGLKQRIGDALTDKLKLPPGLSDMVLNSAEAIQDPEVREHLSGAVQAFAAGNVQDFVSELGAVGQKLADDHKELATGFLDMMGKLPGSVGRFFGDPELNAALVESGAVSEVFQATQKLADGDIMGALGDLMAGAGKVMEYGDNFEINGPVFGKPHVELPFGAEGMEMVGRMATQFVEALPESVKKELQTKIAETVARAGGSAIPGGSIISAIGDGIDLVDELGKDDKDWVAIGLKGAEVALDLAGTIPALGGITAPLRTIVGTIDAIHDIGSTISDASSFGNEFAFGAPA
ncbi:hypothetical protein [Archangium primigenium]|uniref:hypothetical protein n=1 Tax=[Archangium] primigenium TaxID=2792470 RepID=UPI00195D63F8|nr:hypothetical protein [Archangium primigenium]MBM7112376.1 hypothetical protein [Archangium primigenium]